MKYYDKDIEEMVKYKVNILVERGFLDGSPDSESRQKVEENIRDHLYESFIEMVIKPGPKDFYLGINCEYKSGKVADIEMQFHLDDEENTFEINRICIEIDGKKAVFELLQSKDLPPATTIPGLFKSAEIIRNQRNNPRNILDDDQILGKNLN